MGSRAAVALYVLAMIAVVVGVDLLFFRHQFWERLMVNVGVRRDKPAWRWGWESPTSKE